MERSLTSSRTHDVGNLILYYIKGARSRRRARAFFRILTAYTIIILDHHGVVIKFQRSKYAASTGNLRLQVE